MSVSFADRAWEEYLTWQATDKRKLKKINELIKDIMRNGFLNGTGKPEVLKHRPGYSRRIDDANRLEYDGDANRNLVILSCKGHYED